MATLEVIILIGVLIALMTAGFAVIECSKLLHSVDQYKHGVDILEDLYRGGRAELAQTADEVNELLALVDSVIDTNKQILDHDTSVIEDVEKLKIDISMLHARLEDMDDNS